MLLFFSNRQLCFENYALDTEGRGGVISVARFHVEVSACNVQCEWSPWCRFIMFRWGWGLYVFRVMQCPGWYFSRFPRGCFSDFIVHAAGGAHVQRNGEGLMSSGVRLPEMSKLGIAGGFRMFELVFSLMLHCSGCRDMGSEMNFKLCFENYSIRWSKLSASPCFKTGWRYQPATDSHSPGRCERSFWRSESLLIFIIQCGAEDGRKCNMAW